LVGEHRPIGYSENSLVRRGPIQVIDQPNIKVDAPAPAATAAPPIAPSDKKLTPRHP
jgi:hypothetical protein